MQVLQGALGALDGAAGVGHGAEHVVLGLDEDVLHGAVALGHPADHAALGGHGALKRGGVVGVGLLVALDLLIVVGLQLVVADLGDLVAHSFLDPLVVRAGLLHRLDGVLGVAHHIEVVLGLLGLQLFGLALGAGVNGVVGLLIVLLGLGVYLGLLVRVQRQAAALQLAGDGDVLHGVFHDGLLDVFDDVVGKAHAVHGVHLAHVGVLGIKGAHHVLLGDGFAVAIGGDHAGILLLQGGEVQIQLLHLVHADQVAAGQHKRQYDQKARQAQKRVSHSNLPLHPGHVTPK